MRVEMDHIKVKVLEEQNEELKKIAIGYREKVKEIMKELEDANENGAMLAGRIRKCQKKIDAQREMIKAKDQRLQKFKEGDGFEEIRKFFLMGKRYQIIIKKEGQKTA